MDRTIKFRAWDKGWKQIVYPDIIRHNINLGIEIHRAFKPEDGSCYFPIQENLTLMQFTGLLDCEGKEIWESDFVEITLNYPEYTICKIVFKGMGFWFEDTEGELWVYHPETYKLTIIGNLYEHPNLLNNE